MVRRGRPRVEQTRAHDAAPDAVQVSYLVARWQARERAALDHLVALCRPTVHALVRAARGSPEWTDDTVVEILTQVCRSIGSFQGRSSLSTWVHGLAIRVRAAELRKARRCARASGLLALDERDETDPAELAIERHDRSRVLGLVSRLPERYRLAVALHYLHGCTYRRVAEVLGVPEGTAKTWVFRGLRRVSHAATVADSQGAGQ